MKVLSIFISILIIGCSIEKKDTPDTSKHLGEVLENEQLERRELGGELKGDFLIYSGRVIPKDENGLQRLDSSAFIQLVLDADRRFAVRIKFIETRVETDTMTFIFSGDSSSNKGTGNWSDLGGRIELKFRLGTVDSFFDKEDNAATINVIDKYTFSLDKSADEIWIWKTRCRKLAGTKPKNP